MYRFLTCIFFVFAFLSFGYSQNATEIIRKSDEKRRGSKAQAEMTIHIVRPKWTRDMGVKTWALGEEYSMILITSPARDEGNVFLKREKEIWNWVPAIERSIKLPPSMMMQSWMGSDFTNDDLIKESSIIYDYEHTLVGDSVIMNKPVYKIELIPKPDAAVVWGKLYSWISKDDFLELQTEMYDEDGYLVNRVVTREIKDLGGKQLPSIVEFIPVDKPGHKTVLEYSYIDFNIDINKSFFSLQNMKRVK